MDKELNEILEKTIEKGELKDKNHPLVKYIDKNRNNLDKSRIKDSYINNLIEWREYKTNENNLYLFRIIKTINKNVKNLIINEFKIHEENPELNNISPEFICYYFSKFLNFSLFKFKEYSTLEDILQKKQLINFSKKELLLAVYETIINNLNFEDKKKYYICPFLTTNNLLYTEESGKQYFCLSEIFLVSDSIEKEIEIELNISSEWLVPEFQTKKSKISFNSNIGCLGYLFYNILFNEKPFLNEKERKEKKIPKINEDFKHKELIEKCFKIENKSRWSFEEICNYINENDFEEEIVTYHSNDDVVKLSTISGEQVINNEKKHNETQFSEQKLNEKGIENLQNNQNKIDEKDEKENNKNNDIIDINNKFEKIIENKTDKKEKIIGNNENEKIIENGKNKNEKISENKLNKSEEINEDKEKDIIDHKKNENNEIIFQNEHNNELINKKVENHENIDEIILIKDNKSNENKEINENNVNKIEMDEQKKNNTEISENKISYNKNNELIKMQDIKNEIIKNKEDIMSEIKAENLELTENTKKNNINENLKNNENNESQKSENLNDENKRKNEIIKINNIEEKDEQLKKLLEKIEKEKLEKEKLKETFERLQEEEEKKRKKNEEKKKKKKLKVKKN